MRKNSFNVLRLPNFYVIQIQMTGQRSTTSNSSLDDLMNSTQASHFVESASWRCRSGKATITLWRFTRRQRTDCNFENWLTKVKLPISSYFCQEKPFGKLFLKKLTDFLFLKYPAKHETSCLRPPTDYICTEKSCLMALPCQQIEASHSNNHLLY